jgi:hypothetical protein
VHRVTSVSIWGAHAQRFCESRPSARVVAVFARSFHLEAGGHFVCIGDASIGRGPLNAIVDPAGWAWVASHLPTVGAEVRIGHGTIECDHVALVTAAASNWLPPPWPRNPERATLTVALDDLERLACEKAPVEGIARVALTGAAGLPTSALARAARPRIARLREWLGERLVRPTCEPAPPDLVGLGPGLTPSGDDFLCGALVALHAIGQVDLARDLYAVIGEVAQIATSPLSAAFLRTAAEGQSSEPLHATIVALLENRSVAHPLQALAHVGHSSGFDALAGAVLVFRSFAGRSAEPSPDRFLCKPDPCRNAAA